MQFEVSTLEEPVPALGMSEFQQNPHFSIGTAPGELGRQCREVDAVFAVKGIDPETMLLDMMMAAKADAKDVVRLLTGAGIGAGSQMGEVNACSNTSGDAAAVRLHPAAVPWPNFPGRQLHAELWAL